jgi:serine/threonine protein kinase
LPEYFERKPILLQHADYFALGVLLFVLLFGTSPFKKATVEDLNYKYLFADKADSVWAQVKTINPISDDCKDFLIKLCSKDTSVRF